MTECEWCRAPNPQGARVCEGCGGALPPGTPLERPALLSARDREHRGTVIGLGGLGQIAQPGGKTLLHNGSALPEAIAPSESGEDDGQSHRQDRPSGAPLSRVTQSGAPHAVREPPLPLRTPDPGEPPRTTLVGVPAADSPVFTRYGVGHPVESGSRGMAQKVSVRGLVPLASKWVPRPNSRHAWRWDTSHFAALLGGAALVGGTVALVLPKPELVVADFHVTADGHDRIKVRCTDCSDGATLRWGEQTAPFAAGLATIEAPEPLPVGPNHLKLDVLSANGGVTTLPLNLSVAFRVHLEKAGLAAWPPVARLTIEVPPKVRVEVDGKPLEVRGDRGMLALSLEEETRGPSATSREVKRDFRIIVQSERQARTSTAQLRETILPLTFELRRTSPEVGGAQLNDARRATELLGQTRPKATVTLRPLGEIGERGPPIIFKADGQGRIFRRLPAALTGPARIEVSLSGYILRWTLVTL